MKKNSKRPLTEWLIAQRAWQENFYTLVDDRFAEFMKDEKFRRIVNEFCAKAYEFIAKKFREGLEEDPRKKRK
jgi:hypothetical protein